MKKTFFLMALLFSYTWLSAQTDVFSLSNGTNKVLNLKKVEANTFHQCKIVINKAAKSIKWVIEYKTAENTKGWHRLFTIVDEAGNEIVRTDHKTNSGKFTIDLTQYKTELLKNNKLKISTMSLPNDPAQAAVIRVRSLALAEVSIK
jgi:hypothetical protein